MPVVAARHGALGVWSVNAPKRVFFVSLEGPHADGVRLRYGEKGGGLYSVEGHALNAAARLRYRGFNVVVREAYCDWQEQE